MSQLLEISESTVNTEELRCVLEQLLRQHFQSPVTVLSIERTPSQYHSSFPIEELKVTLDNGSHLNVIFKNLSDGALLENARDAKPEFIRNPRREIEVYEKLLSQENLGTAIFYGAVADNHPNRFWLFLEEAPGVELYQVGDLSLWQEAARWLGRMHGRFADRTSDLERHSHLLNRDANFFWMWIRRAEEFERNDSSPQHRALIKRLVSGFDKVIAKLNTLPATFIHGEFYASNVLIDERGEGVRVCPVDWEMAGIGPGLIDLAALVSGNWREDERSAIAKAYHSVAHPDELPTNLEEFLTALDYCRLALAVQWLGWSPGWIPPVEHRHDWSKEAMQLADKLGL